MGSCNASFGKVGEGKDGFFLLQPVLKSCQAHQREPVTS